MKTNINGLDSNSSELIPEIFEFTYSYFIYPSKFVKYENGEFSTEHLENNQTIIPTEENWIKFWEKLDKIGVWCWAEHYSPDYMYLDGTKWDLKIQLGDKKIVCNGSNAYPGKDGEVVENRITFRRLLLAINKLTGLKTVGIQIY